MSIEQAARQLDTTAETIEEQIAQGRVRPKEKRGLRFLSDRDVYKLKFVFYLERECSLSPQQINSVLETVSPPYDTWRQQVAVAVE